MAVENRSRVRQAIGVLARLVQLIGSSVDQDTVIQSIGALDAACRGGMASNASKPPDDVTENCILVGNLLQTSVAFTTRSGGGSPSDGGKEAPAAPALSALLEIEMGAGQRVATQVRTLLRRAKVQPVQVHRCGFAPLHHAHALVSHTCRLIS